MGRPSTGSRHAGFQTAVRPAPAFKRPEHVAGGAFRDQRSVHRPRPPQRLRQCPVHRRRRNLPPPSGGWRAHRSPHRQPARDVSRDLRRGQRLAQNRQRSLANVAGSSASSRSMIGHRVRSAADPPFGVVPSVLALGASALQIGMICCRLLAGVFGWSATADRVPAKARDIGSRPSTACFTAMARSCTASQPRLETARRASTRPGVVFVGVAPHGWYVSHQVLVSLGLLAWLCGRRLPHGC